MMYGYGGGAPGAPGNLGGVGKPGFICRWCFTFSSC